ncbi:MAG: OsmC family protein [Holophagales bacterium]|nr:OsmC family protein [Holophagales bacterium]
MSEEHSFTATVTWDAGERSGELASGHLTTAFGGAPSLGGRADRTNPEELLLGALLACFVQTWAIFLTKLRLPVESPRVEGTLELGADPAGGYRVEKIHLSAHVPAALLAEREADVAKTLALAEKYCIVSKAVKGEGREVHVTPVGV